MSCRLRKYTACDCFSLKIATSTLLPVTSFLPLDCTWKTARCRTRWKPSVGCTSPSWSGAMSGVASSMNSVSWRRSCGMFELQALRISWTFGMSRRASSRCSTVMNSCRRSLAFWNAWFRQNSSSALNMTERPIRIYELPVRVPARGVSSRLFHRAQQGVLLLLRDLGDLRDLRLGDLVSIDAADTLTFRVHLQHDTRGPGTFHPENRLQHFDDKLHRGIVVVDQYDPVHRRRFQLWPRFLDHDVGVVGPCPVSLSFRHN